MDDYDPLDEYNKMLRDDPVISAIDTLIKRGHDELESLKIGMLVLRKTNLRLEEQLDKYERIRPRLFRMDDKLVRWDAPDDLIQFVIGIENDRKV